MSPRSPILLAVLGAALLAPAAALARPPRADDPPQNPVPAGQMQHTVIETTFPADKNTSKHNGFRDERWVGTDAGRELVTDSTTGKVKSDCQVTVTVSRCYWAQIAPGVGPKAGTISIYDGGLGHLLSLLARRQRRLGRAEPAPAGLLPHHRQHHVHRPPGPHDRRQRSFPIAGRRHRHDLADRRCGHLRHALERDPQHRHAGGAAPDRTVRKEQFDQIAETKVMEVIDPTGVKLTIGTYPGAKVTDERPAAVAKRKAAIRRRAAAQCRKHHHSKKYCPQKKGY